MKQNGYDLYPKGGAVQFGKGTASTDKGFFAYTGRLLFQTVASGTPIASTAALTPFDQQPTINKGLLNTVGARVVFDMWGRFSSTGTPSLNVIVRLDDPATGDLISANAVAAVGNNAAGWAWRCRTGFVVRITGGSGTLEPFPGLLTLANNTTGTALVNQVIGPTVTPTNTNANRIIVGAVQWGASSASNSIVVDGMSIEIDYPFATA